MPAKKTTQKVQVILTPITEDQLPDWYQQEDEFTPITEGNANTKELRRLCSGYGVKQDLKANCSFCSLQIRCLNVMRLGIPVKVEHFRQTHYGGKPFFSEAVQAVTDENIANVLGYAVEDIEAYQQEGDPLSEYRVLKLLSHLAETELKTTDPRVPVLLLEKLKVQPKLSTEGTGENLRYIVK